MAPTTDRPAVLCSLTGCMLCIHVCFSQAYRFLAINKKLGLSGRPERPVGCIGTCKVYATAETPTHRHTHTVCAALRVHVPRLTHRIDPFPTQLGTSTQRQKIFSFPFFIQYASVNAYSEVLSHFNMLRCCQAVCVFPPVEACVCVCVFPPKRRSKHDRTSRAITAFSQKDVAKQMTPGSQCAVQTLL